MNHDISKRRSFLTSQKARGHRITIGFAGIADFRSFIGQEYIAGMQKAASDYDLNFINFAGAIKYSFFDDIDFISHYLKTFKFMKAPLIDGLVIWGSSLCEFLDDDSVVSTFSALNPLPMVDIGYLDIPGVPSIRIDNSYSISVIMTHLIQEHSYSKFAFIGCETSTPQLTRLKCYHEQLNIFGIDEIKNSVILTPSMSDVDIAIAVEKLISYHDLHDKQEIECIVTPSDMIAAAVIEELDKHGISVPIDVAVTGFNNQYNGLFARSPVTTIDLAYFKRGYASVELLIDRIMSPQDVFETRMVHTSLLVRQSCGCFEKSVVQAAEDSSRQEDFSVERSSEGDVRTSLFQKVRFIFPHQDETSIERLVNSVFDDIYEQKSPSKMLRWFQNLLQNTRKDSSIVNSEFQQSITSLRKLILPLVRDDIKQYVHMEDVFHQLRALVSIFIEYDSMASREDTYLMNNLSQIAINFASATSGKQIQDVLRYQLSEMGIPGIVLALSENMTSDVATANLELILPEPPADIQEKLPYRITEPTRIPKIFFPQTRRFSVIVEILHYSDKYFGYAFLEVGNPNISIYDTVRTLLSNALNSVYIREGRTKERTALLSNEQVEGILSTSSREQEEFRGSIKASQITNYLMEHLNEMTDLDRMASDLSVSKSHLVRRAKELTGFTIQTLHEKLKIEQAKNLLQVESLKLGEIANRLGFQNQNYFSSVFKKNTGMSPRAWAKRNLR